MNVDPAEAAGEERPVRRLHTSEITAHPARVARRHRGRRRYRGERPELTRELRVEHVSGEHGARANLVERSASRVLIFPPRKGRRQADEHEDS